MTTESREDARSTGHAGELVGRQLFSIDREKVQGAIKECNKRQGCVCTVSVERDIIGTSGGVETKLADGLCSVGAAAGFNSRKYASPIGRVKKTSWTAGARVKCTKLQRLKERRRERPWVNLERRRGERTEKTDWGRKQDES